MVAHRNRETLVSLAIIAVAGTALIVPAQAQEGEKETPEEAAWRQVDCLSAQSLEEFAKKFPTGKHTEEAQLALTLQRKIAAIRADASETVFAIPFETLGERWQSWQKRRPGTGVIGHFIEKSKKGYRETQMANRSIATAMAGTAALIALNLSPPTDAQERLPTNEKRPIAIASGSYTVTKRDPLGTLRGPFLKKAVSQDGCHFAYVTNRNGKHLVVLDGVDGVGYAEIGGLALTPDGRRLAYAAREDRQWFVVADGSPGPTYDHVGAPVFSKDGKRLAYPARTGAVWCVVVDGRAGEGFDAIAEDGAVFSPDGRRGIRSKKSGPRMRRIGRNSRTRL